MDFITALPKSDKCESIIVVVDHYRKYVTFIAEPTDCKVGESTCLFIQYIESYGVFQRAS